jgi:hypothetical protein
MAIMRRLRWFGGAPLLLGLAVGCDHSSWDDLPRQEANLRSRYTLEKPGSTKLSAKEKGIRRQRLRMQYGDVATE